MKTHTDTLTEENAHRVCCLHSGISCAAQTYYCFHICHCFA